MRRLFCAAVFMSLGGLISLAAQEPPPRGKDGPRVQAGTELPEPVQPRNADPL